MESLASVPIELRFSCDDLLQGRDLTQHKYDLGM